MLQRNKNKNTPQKPLGPSPLPPAPALRQLDQLNPATVSDFKALEGRAIRLTTMAIANTLQQGQQTNPFAPREITLLVERVDTGPRGGIEGKILLDPRESDRSLKDAMDNAGMKWLYEDQATFLPLMELRAGYSVINCQVATAGAAMQWIAAALRMIERHKKGLPPNRATLLESLTMPAMVGIAGASLAGALIGFKYISYRDNQPEKNKAAMSNYLSNLKSSLSNRAIAANLGSSALASATVSTTTTTEDPEDSPPPAVPPPTFGDSASSASQISGKTATKPILTKSASSVKYTPQNSADISTLYLIQGQLTFRGDNRPVAINFQPSTSSDAVVLGSLLKVSEGDLIQALALGLDSIRRANQGAFPPGSTFRLVVSTPLYYGSRIGGPEDLRLERHFQIDPRKIPTERELSYDTIINAASGVRDAYEYIDKTLCLNVSKEYHAAPGGYRLASSFALRNSFKIPARLTIVRDTP